MISSKGKAVLHRKLIQIKPQTHKLKRTFLTANRFGGFTTLRSAQQSNFTLKGGGTGAQCWHMNFLGGEGGGTLVRIREEKLHSKGEREGEL